MKSILIGGSDPAFRYQALKVLEPLRQDYELRVLEAWDELEDLLEDPEGDLLLLDMDTPGDMALTWLAGLADGRISIPIVALGSAKEPEIEEYARLFPHLYFPALSYLRKPVSDRRLIETIRVELCDTAYGVVHLLYPTAQGDSGIQLPSVWSPSLPPPQPDPPELDFMGLQFPLSELRPSGLEDGDTAVFTHLERALEAAHGREEITPEEAEAGIPGEPVPETPVPRSRKPWILAACASLLLVAGMGFYLHSQQGRIQIHSFPQGAKVLLNGQFRGETPLNLALPKPKSLLVLELPNHIPQTHLLEPGDRKLTFHLDRLPLPEDASPPLETVANLAPAIEPATASPKPVPHPKPRTPRPATLPAQNSKKPSQGDVFDQFRQ